MIRRIVGWLILVPLCVALVIFALANRHPVQIFVDPLSPGSLLPGVMVPLFVVIYAALLFGIVLGGIATWLAQGPQRRERRLWRREAGRLERERDEALRRPPQAPATGALLDHDGA